MLVSVFCFASTPDDYKYIWAKNGLNLREAPNTSSKIIAKLPFGDSLKIVETTQIKYTNLLIKKTEPEKHPIYLKSHWVKVKVNGKEGFLIDGYLLDLPCLNQKEQVDKYLERMSNRFSSSMLNAKFVSSISLQSSIFAFSLPKLHFFFCDFVWLFRGGALGQSKPPSLIICGAFILADKKPEENIIICVDMNL